MFKGKRFVFAMFMVLSLAPTLSRAQVSDLGNWLIYFGNQDFGSGKWVWHNEIQYRNYNFLENTEQLLLRTGVGKYISDRNNLVSAGYAFVRTRPLGEFDGFVDVNYAGIFQEHRTWQQFLNRHHVGRVFFTHRYRFEQRFFDNNDFRLRARYFLGINIPLNNVSMTANTYYLSVYNEIFMNTQVENNPALFDRNRLYGAIGYQFNPSIRMEVGMMRQNVNNNLFSRNQLQFVVFNNLPIKRKNQ
ncbi:DUF2490 domain-containing protein [Belliella sp. R4-6]|uniref:DUF2490 domain-containing protein n=1 Tax=Belliella alkalica TaxID=1730871 RepID=A0ABS9VAF3_9BACT|nr:DUF2490 domain-containing protein [Belliella alkalica]MCH7413368.1 DUF2490 domain-containing protein [Belliella alkalica]